MPWKQGTTYTPGQRDKHNMHVMLHMVSNPEGLSDDGVITRLQKAEKDHTTMAGVIAEGKDAELGDEEIFSIVV
eukprot:14432679-Heterocapsa_arctica.AAC.1